jgi:Rieske Fe-S protein
VISTRRKFVTWMVTATAAFLAGSGLISLFKIIFPPEKAFGVVDSGPVPIAKVDEIPVGSGIHFDYNNKAALLIHLEDGFYAYDAICTHLGCIVNWDEVQEGPSRMHCPCHAGYFDPKTGEVISGPPPRPQPKIELEIRDGEIFAI